MMYSGKSLRFVYGILLWALLSACFGGAEEEPATQSAPQQQVAVGSSSVTAENRCGDPQLRSPELTFYNYTDYMDERILQQFEQECGVKVKMDTFTSMEEAFAKIESGKTYDVYILTDFSVKVAIERRYLAPLDLSLIPNLKNINNNMMTMFYDSKNEYSLPYQWGTTGLAYDARLFPYGAPKSWAVMFDPNQLCQFKGKATMLDNEREAPGAALVYLGFPWVSTDMAAHKAARDVMLAQKDCLAGYDSKDNFKRLADGELVLAEIWSYGAAFAHIANANIKYTIPDEGGLLWQDNMVIGQDSANKYTAHVFINYLLEPEIGAQLTEFTYAFTPNLMAEQHLSQRYRTVVEEGGLKVTNNMLNRLNLNVRRTGDEIFAETWSQILSE